MRRRPKTIVTIAPTDSPSQAVYCASFAAHIGKKFDLDVQCADAASAPAESLDNLREGIRYAMQHTERSIVGRSDVEYAAYVLPAAVEREPGAGDTKPPFPIVLITVRSWQRTEWTFAYPIERPVPDSVIAEVACSIADVMEERNSRDPGDSDEQHAVAALIDRIRMGIDGALDSTLVGASAQMH